MFIFYRRKNCELTKRALTTLFRCVISQVISSSPSCASNKFTLFYFFTFSHETTAAVLMSSASPSVSLHVRRSSCVEMTGFSQRDDTFGSLFSPTRSPFHPSGQTPQSLTRLPHTLATKRDTHQVILLFNFSPNRGIGECFESAVGIFDGASRINSEEPALLSHMVQHPLINATLCCVTKSQLHHAFYD